MPKRTELSSDFILMIFVFYILIVNLAESPVCWSVSEPYIGGDLFSIEAQILKVEARRHRGGQRVSSWRNNLLPHY